uniref:Serine-threonine kinase receptor-associated protein n=1 Tax=Trichobilharzia regenti TaxID=157069 RepID=A0AA85JMP4_TRIRE|nr:unnamed protein product [Trichobilharzia regenti]
MAVLKQSPILCRGHTRPVIDLSFSSKYAVDNLLLTASKDCKAILRLGDTGDWVGTFLGHDGAVWSCAFDLHADKVATGSADFSAKIWCVNTGKELNSIPHDHIVRCVEFNKTDCGSMLLTADNSKKISIYDVNCPLSPLSVFVGHEETIYRVVWCHGDSLVLSVSGDKTIRLWDRRDLCSKPVSTYLWSKQKSDPVTDIQLHMPPDSENLSDILVACGKSVFAYYFDWRKISLRTQAPEPDVAFNLPCSVNTVSRHPFEEFFVCGGEDHCIYRLELETGEVLARLDSVHERVFQVGAWYG